MTVGDVRHDLAVIGGGLVGAVAALGLARAGRQVLLVDRARPELHLGRLGMDVRNIACSPGSRALLEAVGVWEALTGAPYRQMRVWEEQGTAEIVFTAADVGLSELGWILENSPTVIALWKMLERTPGVRILLGELSALEPGAEAVSLTVGSETVGSRLVIGADGARSRVRSLVGVGVDTLATGHQALATAVRTRAGHRGTAYQRFLLDGPLALLPGRAPDVSSVVWSQSPERAEERLAMDEAAFRADLERASEGRLGEILEADDRFVFPLAQHVVADLNPHPRVLLIGDAARVLHPLAGLGANVGFEDVRDLLARLAGLPAGGDPGTPGIWRAFARKRRIRARLMVSAMAGFRNVYAQGQPLPQWLRNDLVRAVNRSGTLKRQIIREALGLGPLASAW